MLAPMPKLSSAPSARSFGDAASTCAGSMLNGLPPKPMPMLEVHIEVMTDSDGHGNLQGRKPCSYHFDLVYCLLRIIIGDALAVSK